MRKLDFTPKNPLVFDGAMGSYYASKFGDKISCENASLTNPQDILSIHREYLDAGCGAIKTNTFSLSQELARGDKETAADIAKAAIKIAKEAVKGYSAEIFADIGPAPSEIENPGEIYIRQAEIFLENGIKSFLVETLSHDSGINELARFLKSRNNDIFLIVSFAVGTDGVTRQGILGRELFERVSSNPDVDAVGFNCMSGPSHLLRYISGLDIKDTVLSVMPNAGYPTVLGRKIVYQGQSDYYARKMMSVISSGASIIGGCCGTTPEHIRMMCEMIKSGIKADGVESKNAQDKDRPQIDNNPFWDKISSGKRVLAVELDPPVDDRIDEFLEGARKLSNSGADVITVADCPIGRPRVDSSLIACKLKREFGIEPLPHITCRDRNLNATKALLLGLSIEDVHNVLIVTGDPVPTEDRDEVKSVYNFNSRKLAKYIEGLNVGTFSSPFQVFGALNVNAKNFEIQLKLAKEKEACGICGFLTQPVLSREAIDNLKLAKKELKGKILGGIFPIVSHRNAVFLNNEVSGIHISDEIISLYENKSREECEIIAVDISVKIANEIRDFTDGIYLMTPFKRTELVIRIIKELQK